MIETQIHADLSILIDELPKPKRGVAYATVSGNEF
ncbi:MAG: hypothetical protein CM15mP83_9290 [Flavobacteriaceae bacterium]|nr:MAG: hypothetical protein CM15mP83_9290 [Flavobacteriaceae bacterium]